MKRFQSRAGHDLQPIHILPHAADRSESASNDAALIQRLGCARGQAGIETGQVCAMNGILGLASTVIVAALGAFAQGPPPPHGAGNREDRRGPPPPRRTMLGTPPGRWWRDPILIQKLGLAADQQTRIDEIYQQSRLRLIDLNAALQKEQTILEPLLGAEHPDQARAEPEKASARMLLSFRGVLSQDQWRRLQAENSHPRQNH